ncbi:hypothetical protein [Mammaliicoccus sp. E-M24]|uniref:hypothetical protein n=1 Tax=Mammaliicoccus sp. E-M24 TaxID=2898684 RepID=UPI001EFBD015|nr:hypothetical protein [Mammaliicoccus sp. E-M24]
MKKTITYNITNRDIDKILELCSQLEIDFDVVERALNDEFIFYSNNAIKIGRVFRKYMIVRDIYVNEWTSKLVLIMTDSEKEYQKHYNEMFAHELVEN